MTDNITPKKEKRICYPKISVIKNLKLNYLKKNINNNPKASKTSRYFNPLASPSAGAPALKYGDVNTETTSPGEVKGLILMIIN